MKLIALEFASALIQLLAALLIPFIFFFFRKQKEKNFFQYIGFYKASFKSALYLVAIAALTVITVIGLAHLSEGIMNMLLDPHSVTGKLRLVGHKGTTVVLLLIVACIKTSLAEEIFFRGFLAARFTALLGFKIGNLLQAFVFGLVHFILFFVFVKSDTGSLVVLFFLSFLSALLIGYVKEKLAGGSIIPGWVAHAVGNTASYSIVAFLM